MTALTLLALAGAGALGSLLRHLAGVALPARGALPWGVLLVNVAGSFLAGLAVAGVDDAALQLAIVTGFCGGLTTFSTHAVDTVRLARGELGGGRRHASRETGADARRAPSIRLMVAVANVVVTLALTLLAVEAGAALAGGSLLG